MSHSFWDPKYIIFPKYIVLYSVSIPRTNNSRRVWYGTVRCAATASRTCGFFGEASDSFHDLLKTVAKCHAEEVFLERGCETPDEAVPILASELYRDWGTKFTKYRTQFFLSAVHFVSPHFATRPAVRSARMTTAAQQDADNAFYAHARHT